jgi:hypothetical protein
MQKKMVCLGFILLVIINTSCANNSNNLNANSNDTLSSQSNLSISISNFDEAAKYTIEALKVKNMDSLSKIVHPEKGVQISPYGHLDSNKDVNIKANELKDLMLDKSIINWGDYDGSGLPIELTFADYFNKFIYNHDFANAPQKSKNEFIGKGNTANNLFEIFPKNQYTMIEYHFPGFDPEVEGLDWNSLRLVFEQLKTGWKLVAIVHDQWTI